jgi:hypothetical protein
VTSACRKSYIGASASDWIPALEQPERRWRKPERASPPSPPIARGAPASKLAPQPPPDFSVQTVDGCSWDRENRYCRWNLPTHNGRPALGPDTDLQRMLAGQRDKVMQQPGEGRESK